ALRVDRKRIPTEDVRECDPENWLRTLAAQSRSGARECAKERSRACGTAFAGAGLVGTGARARRVGARASWSGLIAGMRLGKACSGDRDPFAIMPQVVTSLVSRFTVTD